MALLCVTTACSPSETPALCEPLATALEPVPHVTLTVRTGDYESVWDGARHRGCEIEFETTDSLRADVPVPDFDAIEGSEMYRSGWRSSDRIRADGPGSGVFGIARDTVSCVVRWEQPSHLDDEGGIVTSETLSMKVQCRRM